MIRVAKGDGSSRAGAETALEFQPDDHPEAKVLGSGLRGRSTGEHPVHRLCDVHGRNIFREIEELAKCHRVYPFLKRYGQSTRRLHI